MSLFRTSIHVLTATFFNLSLLACNNNFFQNNLGAGKKSAKSAAKAESGTAGRVLDDYMPMADALSLLKDAPVGDDVFEWNGYSFSPVTSFPVNIPASRSSGGDLLSSYMRHQIAFHYERESYPMAESMQPTSGISSLKNLNRRNNVE